MGCRGAVGAALDCDMMILGRENGLVFRRGRGRAARLGLSGTESETGEVTTCRSELALRFTVWNVDSHRMRTKYRNAVGPRKVDRIERRWRSCGCSTRLAAPFAQLDRFFSVDRQRPSL